MRRPRSPRYTCISSLPASLPRAAHRTPSTKRIMKRVLSRRTGSSASAGSRPSCSRPTRSTPVSVVVVPRSAIRQPWFVVPAANSATSVVTLALRMPVVVPLANVVVVEITPGMLFHFSVVCVKPAAGSSAAYHVGLRARRRGCQDEGQRRRGDGRGSREVRARREQVRELDERVLVRGGRGRLHVEHGRVVRRGRRVLLRICVVDTAARRVERADS